MGNGSFEIQPTMVGTKQRVLMKQNEGWEEKADVRKVESEFFL